MWSVDMVVTDSGVLLVKPVFAGQGENIVANALHLSASLC